ncbi:hypothetical protein AM593_03365, partial [Mytilus galloprovincialis]
MPSKEKVTPSATNIEDIKAAEFDSSTYMKCKNVGKAVIVSNFMKGYTEDRRLGVRPYADKDCDLLEKALTELGFEPWDGKDSKMVYTNLTKKEFTALYSKEPQEKGDHPFVEQKDLQEAFQPQNNPSLALKPKLFIIQTIPKAGDFSDSPGDGGRTETKRIPREADFLTYTSDEYCVNDHGNYFIKAIVDVLEDKEESALEIQRVLIRMNKKYKEYRKKETKKIPCISHKVTHESIT